MTAFTSPSATVPAVDGDNTANGTGVHGRTADGFGVYGEATGTGRGVVASSVGGYGLRAGSTNSSAIRASSKSGVGIEAAGCTSGIVPAGALPGATDGVVGTSPTGNGVRGESTSPAAAGGHFEGSFEGIHAVGHDPHAAGIAGYNTSTGIGVFGKSANGPAGYFAGNVAVTQDLLVDGNITVKGDVFLEGGSDYAEEFTVADPTVAAGMVVVLDGDGYLRPCATDNDHRVAGIVSGARGLKPAVVLDRHEGGAPVALMGKAWCLADARPAPIKPGDILTTSSTPGHARRISDSHHAPGAMIGKALTRLPDGTGHVLVLVGLR